jgi:hypothetical protein
VWAGLRTTHLPVDVLEVHILPRLHALMSHDMEFQGQLDLARAASVRGIRLPDSDDTASEASSIDKGDSDASDCSESKSDKSEGDDEDQEQDDDDDDDGGEHGDDDDWSDDAGSPDAKRVKEEVEE